MLEVVADRIAEHATSHTHDGDVEGLRRFVSNVKGEPCEPETISCPDTYDRLVCNTLA